MTPDQRLRLAAVCERLAEVVIRDVDPDTWQPTVDPDDDEGQAWVEGRRAASLGNMTRDERGNAVWCRKAAAQSVALLVRVEGLLGTADGEKPPGYNEPDPETEIARAEKAAKAALARCAARPA